MHRLRSLRGDINLIDMYLTHGMSRSPEYHIWEAIVQRCTNQDDPAYHYYGGRGISMHPAWRADFSCFFSDIGPRPDKQHTIERIDNSKGYEPGNVRWATRAEQYRNRRSNIWVTHNGQTLCLTDWMKRQGLKSGTVYYRMSKGQTVHKALDLVETSHG